MNYSENIEKTSSVKAAYVEDFKALIRKKQLEAEDKRFLHAKDILTNPEAYRTELTEMLGWPLTEYNPAEIPTVAKSEKLAEENRFTIYRMTFEILEGFHMTGLYYEQKGNKKRPLVIAQHGGWGTPERISGFYDNNTSNYNDMLERILQFDVNIFAPQLLLWNIETFGNEYNRHEIDAQLKSVGSSVTAVEIYGIRKILDYFSVRENTSTLGMIGLSYGGFYTLFTAAIDTRIKACISCSFFNSRKEFPWNDWVWDKSFEKLCDAEIACLVYPRNLCIALGKNDDLFTYNTGVEEFERLKSYCKDINTDWLSFIGFDGTHEFIKDDDPIQKCIEILKN